MKKIVILATYIGVVNRGAETFVIELVKKLSNEFNFEVYALGESNEIKDYLTKVDIKLPKWFYLHNFLFENNWIYNFICNRIYIIIPNQLEQRFFSRVVFNKFLKGRKDIDLIFPANGLSGVILARKFRDKFKVPFIYTGHGGIGEGEKRIIKQNPNVYITLSDVHQSWASKYSDKTIKINNGVDVEKFRPNQNLFKSGNKKILCVAAFTEFKRQKLLINAVEKLSKVDLVLIGKGELEDEIMEYGNTKLGNRISVLSVDYSEISRFYDQCDVFSLPSINEPFGIVYLEALAMNKPIVAPNDSVRREIIGNAGYLCNVEDANEYADALQNAFKFDWQQIPRERAVINFSWDKISLEYKSLFWEIANSRNL